MDILAQLKQDLYGKKFDYKSLKYTNMFGPDLKTAYIKKPHVNEVIKKYQNNEELSLDNFPLDESVELTTIYFVLSLIKIKTLKDQLDFLDKKVRFAKSWAITDTIQQSLKKLDRNLVDKHIKKWSKSNFEYEKRFAYIIAMKFYKENDVKNYLEMIDDDQRYYVLMAEAWLLATLAITHKDEVMALLRNIAKQNPTLTRKTIQKICDSFRIQVQDKEEFKKIRLLISD